MSDFYNCGLDVLGGDWRTNWGAAHDFFMPVVKNIPIASALVPVFDKVYSASTGLPSDPAERAQAVAEQQAPKAAAPAPAPSTPLPDVSRLAADKAAANVRIAQARAATEADPNGPYHQLAARAARVAASLRSAAAGSDAAITPTAMETKPERVSKVTSPWTMVALGGIGLTAVAGIALAVMASKNTKHQENT